VNILANILGWRFDESIGSHKLVHNNAIVIFFEKTDQSISTQENLLIGTKEECEAEIQNLNLEPLTSPIIT
jgi:hypothetical protein